jgi:apolipoprotein D and lipocalin family protein
MKPLKRKASLFACLCALLPGCTSLPPIPTVSQVDLNKFMGDWYVIACIPTLLEKNIYNPVESYKLLSDDKIQTTFTFHQDSFDGPIKRYNPTGYVIENTGNALWGMQFIWPIKAEYRIVYLDKAYQTTIIARNARDYVWLMARSPTMAENQYNAYISQIGAMGYDVSKVIKMQHKWDKKDN